MTITVSGLRESPPESRFGDSRVGLSRCNSSPAAVACSRVAEPGRVRRKSRERPRGPLFGRLRVQRLRSQRDVGCFGDGQGGRGSIARRAAPHRFARRRGALRALTEIAPPAQIEVAQRAPQHGSVRGERASAPVAEHAVVRRPRLFKRVSARARDAFGRRVRMQGSVVVIRQRAENLARRPLARVRIPRLPQWQTEHIALVVLPESGHFGPR